jgi:tRNA modification GTPase
MTPDPQDTIVALASAPGSGARAIVRLSGPSALGCVSPFFTTSEPILSNRRRYYAGHLQLTSVTAVLPADLYIWPGPRSYTGQEIVELHTISCPPLVDLLIGQLLNAGARAAQPGEFTLRAFLAGKLDLTRAEAVLGVIEAGNRTELKQALAQLAGGVTRPLEGLREDLVNLLADIEAGLDFSEEDIHFVGQDEMLKRLAKGLAQLVLLRKQLDARAVEDRPFRVVLAGQPNAGKSSLFNALGGSPAALVSAEPGTTRDYLVRHLDLGGVTIELVDTAGWQSATSTIEAQAQTLGKQQAEDADLLLLCLDVDKPADEQEQELLARQGPPIVIPVTTKCDLGTPPPERLATSAVTGAGLEDLRASLAEYAQKHAQPALAPSLSRCRHHVEACLERLRQAHDIVLNEDPAELLALELRGALDELGAMIGAVYTDDLLDRIFSRFCIGK